MDLQEWELLPNDGFLETHDDGGKKIFSRKFVTSPKNFFIDHFSFQSPNPQNFVDSSSSPLPLPSPSPRGDDSRLPKKQVIPLPIRLEYPIVGAIPTPDHDHEEVKLPIVIMGEATPVLNGTGARAEHESANSQVSFKNLKETQFDDMKIDSPRMGSCSWGIAPQIETCMFQYKEKSETSMDGNIDRVGVKDEMLMEEEDVIAWGGSNEGHLNLWKWGLSGIGAVCSFGMAAATICIIILGNGQRNKHHRQNQKLRFQIYSDEKTMKQVVHHATNLNEAMTAAMRGVPYSRAHITHGGYYDGF